jgi:hypothetical protein
MTAPDQLDPYAATFCLEPRSRIAAPEALIARLLDDIARRCTHAGCSVIGHIKCHAGYGEHAFSCSLTSLRAGSTCKGPAGGSLAAGQRLKLDLVVLVYGLPLDVTDAAVAAALSDSLPRSSGEWRAIAEDPPHHHEH